MKLIDKHIFKEFIPVFLFCLTLFLFLFVIIDLFANLDDIIEQKVGIQVLLQYYSAFLPSIFTIVTPVSTLLATLYSLGALNRQNEIIAMKAGGVSTFSIIAPYLFMGLIISLLSFIVDNEYVPNAYQKYNTIKNEQIEKPGKNERIEVIKDVTLYGADYRIYYAKSYNTKTTTLQGLIILQHDDQGDLTARITADEAKYINDKWVLYNCAIYRLTKTGARDGAPAYFKEKIWPPNEKPKDFARSKHQTQFMSVFELYRYTKKLAKNNRAPAGILIDLYNKVSFSFVSFVVVLIGLPFALMKNRGGTFVYIGIGLGISFFYYVILITSVAMGKAGFLPPFLSSWLANIIFSTIGIIMLSKISK
jgi:lipopolysaccharide export system permease protein